MLASLSRAAVRAAVRVAATAQPLIGGAITIEGNTLDPELRVVLAAAARAGLGGIEKMSPEAARAYSARALTPFDALPRVMARVTDTAAPSTTGGPPIPIRIYEPPGARAALLVYLHGGGGVIGSIESYDLTMRMLATRTGCQVASVEYRLAPEHPHPAAIDDALDAWRWAHDTAPSLGVDPARIGVAGDSFGGFLAAWVDLRASVDDLHPPAVVGLMYPLVDLTLSHRSHDTFASGFLLTRPLIHWFRNHYCPDVAARKDASPWFVPDADLAGSSPTVVVTAGFDPLRDEGDAWAARLRAAGARVTHRCHGEQVHGFFGMTGGFRRADAAAQTFCDDLASELLR
jgi:acetyl esterase